jgi:glutathione S-transferase
MKLAFSPASPYVRKCSAVAIARGIDAKVEKWTVGTTDPALLPVNPLSKVPSLVTDDGVALYDSPVICEYLDSIGDAPKLFPAAGPARGKALQLQALGDGILAASQPRRREVALPQDDGRKEYIAQQQGKVARALDALEAEAGSFGMLTTIGEITVGCALGYLDFRFPHEPWRPGHPKLEAWYAKVVALPPLAKTMPFVPG